MGRRSTRILLVFALLLTLALQLVHMTHTASATWDEPHHLFDGYTVWTEHSFRLNPEVPPLIKLTAALPLLGERLAVPPNLGRSVPNEAFLSGRTFVFGNGADRTLGRGRLACMAYTLALGLLIYLAALNFFGPAAGLFALALFAFDPNFIAHGALVTTDAGSACLFVAAVYAFYRYCRQPSGMWLALSGLAAGLLLAAKFTGIFIAPMLVLIVFGEWLLGRSGKLLARRLLAVAVVGLCAWAVLWAFYGFRYRAVPAGAGEIQPALATYLGTMHDQADARRLAALARFRLLPEAYIWGLENTKNTEWEDTSYFWGRVYRHGNWQYFPVAFLIKSTLPLLLLLCLTPFAFAPERRRYARELLFLVVPVAVYFAISMHSDFDIGVRHLLPVYAFLYILVGGAAALLVARDRRWAFGFGALLCWQIVTTARVAPAYMAYGNEAWGGPAQVHRYLSDANVDWGQQLISVRQYLQAHRITDCWFAYFPDGAIEPSDYGVPCKRLPTTDSLWWYKLPMPVPPPVLNGTVLISDSDLEGIEFGDGSLNPYDSFRARKPDASVQYGVHVYNGTFALPLASALVLAHEAGKLAKAGHLPEALAAAQRAAALAPGSVHTQSQLGDALAASGQRDAALQHYALALHAAQTVRPDLQAADAAEVAAKIHTLTSTAPTPPAP